MNDFWLYLLKSGLSLWLFYGVYWFFLRKETFFSMNRFILLGSVIISLLLPALRFENLINLGTNRVVPSFFIELGDEPVKSSLPSTSNSGQHVLLMNWFLYLLIIYLAGIIILGMRLVYQATRLLLIRKKHELVLKDGMKLVFVDQDITPFSWWNIIFLNRSVEYTGELDKIIRHEKAHFRNMHFIDLLLVGFVALLQWFNPVMWFLERSIREIHEYEADREVLKWDTDRGKYQALLVNQMTGIELFRLGNGFSKSLTKKRMIMMTKIKSPKTALLKSLFILPVIAILTMAFGEKSRT